MHPAGSTTAQFCSEDINKANGKAQNTTPHTL